MASTQEPVITIRAVGPDYWLLHYIPDSRQQPARRLSLPCRFHNKRLLLRSGPMRWDPPFHAEPITKEAHVAIRRAILAGLARKNTDVVLLPPEGDPR